eukprot:CAMPEP_0113605210 /NCGR_PEP_ID=MMETSP0017_2-20120614/2207_1 /TAXON_ID=2856 /ORGANISM="Cylindrotheca closterium" /LENGTH=348 /DNA_ID=CAMNT_0000513687 /DNA_START=12 /DNA_END=1058 /DNA_ORIENTATION=- /assembly_acc=CAM_ASM_000147
MAIERLRKIQPPSEPSSFTPHDSKPTRYFAAAWKQHAHRQKCRISSLKSSQSQYEHELRCIKIVSKASTMPLTLTTTNNMTTNTIINRINHLINHLIINKNISIATPHFGSASSRLLIMAPHVRAAGLFHKNQGNPFLLVACSFSSNSTTLLFTLLLRQQQRISNVSFSYFLFPRSLHPLDGSVEGFCSLNRFLMPSSSTPSLDHVSSSSNDDEILQVARCDWLERIRKVISEMYRKWHRKQFCEVISSIAKICATRREGEYYKAFEETMLYAVKEYTGNSFQAMNEALRRSSSSSGTAAVETQQQVQKLIQDAIKAFNVGIRWNLVSRCESTTTLYRGCGSFPFETP